MAAGFTMEAGFTMAQGFTMAKGFTMAAGFTMQRVLLCSGFYYIGRGFYYGHVTIDQGYISIWGSYKVRSTLVLAIKYTIFKCFSHRNQK